MKNIDIITAANIFVASNRSDEVTAWVNEDMVLILNEYEIPESEADYGFMAGVHYDWGIVVEGEVKFSICRENTPEEEDKFWNIVADLGLSTDFPPVFHCRYGKEVKERDTEVSRIVGEILADEEIPF